MVSISDSFFKSVFGSSADKRFRWEHSHDLWKTHSYVPASKPPLFSYGKDDHQPYSRVLFTHPKIRFQRLDDHPSYQELTGPSAQVRFILTLVISLRSLECQGPWVLRTRIETPWKFKMKQKKLERNSLSNTQANFIYFSRKNALNSFGGGGKLLF